MPFHRPVVRLAVVSAAVVALAAAAPAVAAPPVVSGADTDQWSTAPTYTVSAAGPLTARVSFTWTASNGQSGTSDVSPFTVALSSPPFAEGPGSFTVSQRPRGIFQPVESTTRAFTVDLTPPASPALSAPETATAGTAVPVTWGPGEGGARFRLQVRRDTGQVVHAAETTGTAAEIVPLERGVYVVGLTQVDVAGNVSPEATSVLTIPDTPVPAFVPPEVVVQSGPVPLRLSAINANRLTPRATTRLSSRRPVLRWARGPAGTRLYNLQVFRVYPQRRTASGQPLLRKVSSTFPAGLGRRTPLLARGACYVWRVWPYRASGFTAKPLGVSNFCVTVPRTAAR